MQNNLIKFTAFIFLSFISFTGFSQDDFEKKYLLGKDLISKGKYDPAMEVLKPLTTEDEDNKFIKYAHYYYSLAALKGGRLQEAFDMLLQLTTRYPDWDKIDEANYLMANVYFEQKKYKKAISLLDGKKKDLKESGEQMKQFYLSKAALDTLVDIQMSFPEDPLIAKVLAKRLNTASELNEKQRMLFEYLIQEFKLDKEEFNLGRKSEIKSSYNVAVLFPFLLKELNPSSNSRSNQYVYDLYQGMLMAADSLRKKGVNINVLAYDTERNESKVSELLNLPEMKSMDLIVGPVYPQHYAKVNEFGLKNQILVLNPLSENADLLEGNPYVYLFQPTLRNTAGAAARFASQNFVREIVIDEKKNKKNTTGVKPEPEFTRHVIIFQSPTSRDSLLANHYKDSVTANGFEIKDFEVVSKENMKRVQEILSDSIKLLKVSHIFVASTDQVLAANIVSAMEISGMNIPIVTGPEWLQFPLLTYDQYERRELHFLYPEFVSYDKMQVRNFRKKYYSKCNTVPFTNHAYQGYDLMLVFGDMMGKYGNYFAPEMAKQGFIPGQLISGFNFSFSRSNSFVPVVKFVNSNLTVLNFPEGTK